MRATNVATKKSRAVAAGVVIAAAVAIFVCAAEPAAAGGADGLGEILQGLRRNLAPATPSVRNVEMTIRSGDGVVVKWAGRQAYKVLPEGPALLTVLTGPPEVKGFAVLIREVGGGDPEIWSYVPPVRRVRRLTRVGGEQFFLGSDLTVSDLGFWTRSSGNVRLHGLGNYRLQPAYELHETPAGAGPFKRITTWVHQHDLRPLERRFFDPSGRLWRTQHFSDFKQVGKSMLPMAVRVIDVQEGGTSELRILELEEGTMPEDGLFDPKLLAKNADPATW